jgi:zinc protease
MVVAVVGDIETAALSTLLTNALSSLPADSDYSSDIADAVWLGAEKIQHYDMKNAQTEIQFGWKAVKRASPDFYAAYILNHMLGGSGLTSKLSLVIRGEHGLSYSVGTGLASYQHGAVLKGSFATRHDQAEKAVSLLRETTTQIAKEGFTQEELQTAQRYLTGEFPLRLASNRSLVQYLLTMRLDALGEDYLEKRNGYMNAVTLEDVNRLAKEILAPEQLLIVTTGSE